MRVAFFGYDPSIASTRYRAIAPAQWLKKNGVEPAGDDAGLLVINKHGWDESILDKFPAFIYDICDDWFKDEKDGPFYKRVAKRATALTCNSDVMRFRIHQETGRTATVIPDAYEHEIWEPSWGDGLFWYGNAVNLGDFVKALPKLKGINLSMGVVSRHEEFMSDAIKSMIVPWSPTAVDKGFKSCAIVIIPTGMSAAKSANRLIEAVMAGKFVVAEPLPAYEEFGRFMWVGDLREGVDWAITHRKECLSRVRECQKYIKKHYSMDKIGPKWLEVIKKNYPWKDIIARG